MTEKRERYKQCKAVKESGGDLARGRSIVPLAQQYDGEYAAAAAAYYTAAASRSTAPLPPLPLAAPSASTNNNLDGLSLRVGTAAQQQPAAEPNCEWISRSDALELPEFPQLPRELDFALPPIPRLLPSWEQLQQLQSRGVRPAGTLEASRAHRDEPHASTASSALVATAGVAGFLVAFGVGVAFAWRVRRWQLPSLAIRKRQRPLGKEFGSERTSTL